MLACHAFIASRWRQFYGHLSVTIRELPTLAVSTVIVVAARNALFLVRGQLTRSRSPQATRTLPSNIATKLIRQIILFLWPCKRCWWVLVVLPQNQRVACHCPTCLKASVYQYFYGFFMCHALISISVIWLSTLCACTLTPEAFSLFANCVLYVCAEIELGLSKTIAL